MFIVAYILAALVFTIQCNSILHGRPLAARDVLREGLGRLIPYAATTIIEWMVVIIADCYGGLLCCLCCLWTYPL